jgi:hypothetical protein
MRAADGPPVQLFLFALQTVRGERGKALTGAVTFVQRFNGNSPAPSTSTSSSPMASSPARTTAQPCSAKAPCPGGYSTPRATLLNVLALQLHLLRAATFIHVIPLELKRIAEAERSPPNRTQRASGRKIERWVRPPGGEVQL